MPQIFTPEHYRTGEQYGYDFTQERQEAEILAEMDLTLNVLQGNDYTLSISPDDLVSYHFLHYGGLRGASRFAVNMLLSGGCEDLMPNDMQDRLPGFERQLSYAIGPRRLSTPLPMGRISLSAYPIGSIPGDLKLPEEFTEYFDGHVPIEPLPSRAKGPFLYPKEEVDFKYLGTSRTNTPSGKQLFDEMAKDHPSLTDRGYPNLDRNDLIYPDDMPTLHLDKLALEAEGRERRFVAISSESTVLAIEPVSVP